MAADLALAPGLGPRGWEESLIDPEKLKPQ